ncbi:putative amidoligase enzyme-domain-containing protein [Hypoxylon cercidicola]|nr:putative amidoligase enzyme-domain-containing protein [Hypoxylon cercidicola]
MAAPAYPETPGRFKLQVATRHSVGIELEFLVAYLPTGVKDPLESDAGSLPPLLRVDSEGYHGRVEAIGHVRKTLREHGIDVANPLPPPLPADIPRRLQSRDMWEVGLDATLREPFYDGFEWIPMEIRSPAFWAREESYKEISYVVNLLKSCYRLRVNPTCGFHVHVGNGRKFFPADTIKRLGAFLWAADPILSRLHAPWRRVNEFSPSIRYLSKLACEGKDAAAIEKSLKERPSTHPPIDPIAVTDFSDTSIEEKEYAGKQGWDVAASFYSQVGPFMTFGEDLDDIEDYEEDSPERPDEDMNKILEQLGEVDVTKALETNEHDTDLARAAKEMLTGLLEQSIPSHELPPEESALYRNLDWARWDEIEDGVLVLLDEYCEARFGHRDLRRIATDAQVLIMLEAQSTFLFGQRNMYFLSSNEQSEVLERSAKYFQAARSSYRLDGVGRWELVDWSIDSLSEPDSEREIKIDAPKIIRKFDSIAALMDMQGEHSESGIEYVSRAEHDRVLESAKDFEKLIDGLRDYAESPPPDYAKDNADYLPGGRPPSQRTPPTPHSDGDYIPPAWTAAREPWPSPPAPPVAKVYYTKLKPHDPDDLPAGYVDGVNSYMGIPAALWDRISWLPSAAHALPDPAAALTPEDYRTLVANPKVSTSEGVYEIMSCGSALAAATLLRSTKVARGNYNFDHYTEDFLEDGFAPRSTNPRTVEFREAEGSLDARWVAAWARICVGVVRFARRAPVGSYLHVLERIRAQELRELARKEALLAAGAGAGAYEFEARDEARRYDVCDLLEDIGLFAEAEFVRQREETRQKDLLDQVSGSFLRRS